MSEEILLNITPTETRVAVVDGGQLQEVHIERASSKGLVGNIYKGKVQRVLPGMQAAFVDIGLDRASFLHISDIYRDQDEGPEPAITDVLHEGQKILVQVMKDPLGTKGARVTTQLTFSSRYLVYMPQINHVGISQRIEDEEERERLRQLVTSLRDQHGYCGGYIVRTSGEGFSQPELESDMQFLGRLWAALQKKQESLKVPAILHEDMPLYMRTIRDLVRANTEKIRVDSRETFGRMHEFASTFEPAIVNKLDHYNGELPLFEMYGVEDEILKSLARKVGLKSGGYLIIDQTEAMTTIDVNTGGFVGRKTQEETIFKTNLEAATALARQLRIRNLGGIIIIDFIDMQEPEHKQQVIQALEKALLKDLAKTSITELSQLGLVEMTRKRTRESLEHLLCEPCNVCSGRGYMKTSETVCYEVFREILREARQYDNCSFRVLASQSVVDRLLDEEADGLADLEEFIGKPIRIQVEPSYNQEQFDVVPS